jgi:acetylglutamate kinase
VGLRFIKKIRRDKCGVFVLNKTTTVRSTLAYVKKLVGTTLVVKLGGAAIAPPDGNRADGLATLYEDLGILRSLGVKVILVHGGGPRINEELRAQNIAWEFIDGQRVTTPEILKVIESVMCGQVNREIVRSLNLAGVPAIGLTGVEVALLSCRPAPARLGKVGVIEEVNTSVLEALLDAKTKDGFGVIPVIAPLGFGADHEVFNVNADWAASRIGQAFNTRKTIYLTDQDGILSDNQEVIPELDASELEEMVLRGQVTGGMLTKVRTILDALKNGTSEVHVLNGRSPHVLTQELFTETGVGTICRARARRLPRDEVYHG